MKQVRLELIRKGPRIEEEMVERDIGTDVDGMGEGDILTDEEFVCEVDTIEENI